VKGIEAKGDRLIKFLIPIGKKEWSQGAGGIIADIARKEGIKIPLVINEK